METNEKAIKRAFKGVRGVRSASKFERGRRLAKRSRESAEEGAYRSVSYLTKQTELAQQMLHNLLDPRKREKRIAKRARRRR